MRDCVAILFCHYETPLRRRGNLRYTANCEIASVVSLPRNDITAQSVRGNDNFRPLLHSPRRNGKFGKSIHNKNAHRGLCMGEGIHFVGVGEPGNRVIMELHRIYEGMRDGLFSEEHDQPKNHLHIHSYPCTEMVFCDGEDIFIILAGSTHDPCLQDARNTLHERRPYFMLTIAMNDQAGTNTDAIQPFPDECLVFREQSIFDPVKIAQLVLQIFLIHTPWYISKRGSLVGYDLYDTKPMFTRKFIKVITMTSDKKHYRQYFSKFLEENRAELRWTKGILMSLWGFSTISDVSDLCTETTGLLMPDAIELLTYHDLPDDEPNIMVTLFIAL